MKQTFFCHLAAVAAIVLTLTGCASKVSLPEILQQPQDTQVRTRYHIWYTDSENISMLNYMEGKFIPAGTVIEPIEIERGSYDMWGTLSVTDGIIKFRTPADGKEYTMKYDEHLTMLPIDEYLRQLFTVAPESDIYKNVPQAELADVKAGKLKLKMSKNSVLVLLGPPSKSRTPEMNSQSWLYWKNRDVVFRLLFRGDNVRQITSLDELKF